MCQLSEHDESDSDAGKSAWPHIEPVDDKTNTPPSPPLGEVEDLLNQDLYDAEESPIDYELEKLWYRDFGRLAKARAELSSKVKDPKLAVVLRSRVASMVGTLNLYLNNTLLYTWRQASELASKAQGKGTSYARKIRTWIHTYLDNRSLPKDNYGTTNTSLLADEDFAQSIQLYLLERSKGGYLTARDVVDFVATAEMQERIKSLRGEGTTTTISLRTANRWLNVLNWRYGKKKRGMYIDGHERDDVVEYRRAFIKRWKEEYEPRMVVYGDDGKILKTPKGFPVPQGVRFRLILITHDESTFYENDRRKTLWQHTTHAPTPERKGEGESLMISDFLTPEWGWLKDDEEYAMSHCSQTHSHDL